MTFIPRRSHLFWASMAGFLALSTLLILGMAGVRGFSLGRAGVGTSPGYLEIAWSPSRITRQALNWGYVNQTPDGITIGSGSVHFIQRYWWKWRSHRHNLALAPVVAGPGAAGGPFLRVIILPLWLPVVLFAGSTALLAPAVLRRRKSWECPECGYDLRGASGECCPECGKARQRSVLARVRSLLRRRWRRMGSVPALLPQ